jgi:hypothetical protein
LRRERRVLSEPGPRELRVALARDSRSKIVFEHALGVCQLFAEVIEIRARPGFARSDRRKGPAGCDGGNVELIAGHSGRAIRNGCAM